MIYSRSRLTWLEQLVGVQYDWCQNRRKHSGPYSQSGSLCLNLWDFQKDLRSLQKVTISCWLCSRGTWLCVFTHGVEAGSTYFIESQSYGYGYPLGLWLRVTS